MQPNIPLRILRVIVGCAAGTLILVLTLVVLLQKRSMDLAGLPRDSENRTLAERPTWTAEQLEPKFAYVQYATDLDYLCNAASATMKMNIWRSLD